MARKRLPPDDPREWLNRARSNLPKECKRLAEAADHRPLERRHRGVPGAQGRCECQQQKGGE